MVTGESPEWLPPGFTVKIQRKNGKKVKYYLNVATGKRYHSKNEVIRCAAEYNSLLVSPQTKNADDNGPSSIDKVDAISDKTNDSAAWLPNGWTVEERRRKSGTAEGAPYKVYIEPSTGSRFYSKAAVTRYLNTLAHTDIVTEKNKSDNVDELVVPDKSPQIIYTTTNGAHEQKRKENSLVTIDNVGEPFPEMTPPVSTDGIPKKKRKSSSFVTVAIERTTADDLHSGWIKEIRTSKSGNRTRKDPYYIDPVSGYMFRSKPDALRYLKTNDIGSCSCKPLKMELDDIKLIENNIPSSTPANQKISMHKRQRCLGEESNGGGESSGMKSPAESDTETLKQKQVNHDDVKVTAVGALSLEERVSCENSDKNAKMGNNPEPESDVSKKDVQVMATDAAMSPPVTDPSTNQQFSESGGSRKSKKRKESSTPLRTSKRLAGSEPEMQSNLNLSERSLRAAVKVFAAKEVDTSPSLPLEASDIPETSNIEPAKEAVDHAVIREEARQDVNQLQEVEKPLAEGSVIPEEQKPPTEGLAIPEEHTPPTESSAIPEVQKPPTDSSAIPEEQKPPTESSAIPEEQWPPTESSAIPEEQWPPTESSAILEEQSDAKANENPLVGGQQTQESQLCYDFGDSWSDPLEFALKTLRGELPIEHTLTFPSCFEEQLDTTFSQVDGCLKQSEIDAPINFQNEFVSHSESSKKQNAVDPSPATSPSFSALGNIGPNSCGGFNYQPSTELGKKDSQTKFNP